jgi:phosphoribosylaminoimidazole (AIR) synthetase
MRSGKNLSYRIETMLPYLPVFAFVEERANLSKMDMLKTFNCGAGFAIFVATDADAVNTIALAESLGYKAIQAGVILPASASREVVVEPLGLKLTDETFLLKKS